MPGTEDDYEGADVPTGWYRRHVIKTLTRLEDQNKALDAKLDSEASSIKKELREKYVTKEIFELVINPIKRVGWLIFSVVTTGLIGAILALVIQSRGAK